MRLPVSAFCVKKLKIYRYSCTISACGVRRSAAYLQATVSCTVVCPLLSTDRISTPSGVKVSMDAT